MRWAVCRCLAGRVRSSASHWDEMDKGTQDGPGPGLSASVTGRAGVPQGLPDRATMMVTLQGDLANTFTLDEVGSSNLFPLVHLEHSYLRLLDFILAYRNQLRWGHFLSSLHPEVGPFQTSIHRRRSFHSCCSPCHFSLSRTTVLADTGASSPNSPRRARSKSPAARPCRYSSGISWSTSRVRRAKKGNTRLSKRSSRPRTLGRRTRTVPQLKSLP